MSEAAEQLKHAQQQLDLANFAALIRNTHKLRSLIVVCCSSLGFAIADQFGNANLERPTAVTQVSHLGQRTRGACHFATKICYYTTGALLRPAWWDGRSNASSAPSRGQATAGARHGTTVPASAIPVQDG